MADVEPPLKLYISEHLRAAKQRGIRYAAMAEAMRVGPATITKWRNGRNLAKLQNLTVRDARLRALARLLHLRPIDFLFLPDARPDVNALLAGQPDDYVRSVAAFALHMGLHRY